MKGVNADGQIVEAGLIQRLYDSVPQEEPIRYDARVRFPAGVGDEIGDVRVHQRLPPEHRDIRRVQAMQSINALLEHVSRYGLREAVVFRTVATAQVAATGDNELGVEWGVSEEDAWECGQKVLNLHQRRSRRSPSCGVIRQVVALSAAAAGRLLRQLQPTSRPSSPTHAPWQTCSPVRALAARATFRPA